MQLRELRQQKSLDLSGGLVGFRQQCLSQHQMVEEMNNLGIKTARGGEWSLMQLQRVLNSID